jgi:ATP-binding cassette, subfamily B, bacterial
LRENIRAYVWAWRVASQAGWWRIGVVILANLLLGLHGIATAVSLGIVVGGVARADQNAIVGGSLALAALVAVMFGVFSVMIPAQTTVTERAIHEIDQRLIRLTSGLGSIDPFEHPTFYDRLTTVRREPAAVVAVVWSTVSNLSFFVGVGAALTALAYVDPFLLLLPFAGVPVIFATRRAGRIRNQAVDDVATSRRSSDHLFSVLSTPAYAKEIRVFKSGPFLLEAHRSARRAGNVELSRADLRATGLVVAGWTFFGIAWGVALTWVVHSASLGRIGVGQVATVIAMIGVIQNQVSGLSGLTRDLISGAGMAKRFLWLEEFAAKVRRPATAARTLGPDEGIAFSDVSYRYSGAEIDALADINVYIPAGSSVMVVGENGAGKSTFVRLLLGLSQPTTGSVALQGAGGGPPVSGSLTSTAAFQDGARFEFTLGEAIGIGSIGHIGDKPLLSEALSDSGARFSAEDLDEQLGQQWGGRELSGGQWQQVAVARAFMRRSVGLLVFDEPNAGLDPIIEDRLYRRYMSARAHIAAEYGISVLVTHRISPGVHADMVLVFHEGTLAEVGSHDELVRRGGRYSELYDLQVRAYE